MAWFYSAQWLDFPPPYRLGDAKTLTGWADLEGRTFEIRYFLVEGKAAPCLAEADLSPFMETLARMHDDMTAAEVSHRGP